MPVYTGSCSSVAKPVYIYKAAVVRPASTWQLYLYLFIQVAVARPVYIYKAAVARPVSTGQL